MTLHPDSRQRKKYGDHEVYGSVIGNGAAHPYGRSRRTGAGSLGIGLTVEGVHYLPPHRSSQVRAAQPAGID